jgi:hypothetical protein
MPARFSTCALLLKCGANVAADKQVCRPRRDGFCEDDALCSGASLFCPKNPIKTDTSFVSIQAAFRGTHIVSCRISIV